MRTSEHHFEENEKIHPQLLFVIAQPHEAHFELSSSSLILLALYTHTHIQVHGGDQLLRPSGKTQIVAWYYSTAPALHTHTQLTSGERENFIIVHPLQIDFHNWLAFFFPPHSPLLYSAQLQDQKRGKWSDAKGVRACAVSQLKNRIRLFVGEMLLAQHTHAHTHTDRLRNTSTQFDFIRRANLPRLRNWTMLDQFSLN